MSRFILPLYLDIFLSILHLTCLLTMVYTVEVKSKKKSVRNSWQKEGYGKRSFCGSKFVEFCERTDLHGYKYIVMEDLNLAERCCWAIAVLLSIGIAAFFVVTAYRWYARNPIVTVIESTHGSIWDVPFPAVTICDLNLVSRKAARELAQNLTLPANVSADYIFDTLRLTPQLHSSFNLDSVHKQDLYTLQNVLDVNNISMKDLFKTLSPASSCNHIVQRCMWKNTIYRCDLLFEEVYTHLTLCCAFNYYAVETTNKKSKVQQLKPKGPRRVASCGYQTALTVLVNSRAGDYYSATVASQGLLVFIDNAYNIPDLDSPFRIVNPSTEVLIALSPESTYATPGIKAFAPETRQCYYSDEIKIGSLQQYSYHNCIAFQKVETIRKKCNCIPFFFPIKENYRTCNFHDIDCLEYVQSPTVFRKRDTNDVSPCLPECEHFDYPLEVALGTLAMDAHLNGLAFFNDVNMENRSLLNVFFNDLVSTRYRRDVYLNWQNILASFGGLLSLMLGFTLISGFDFIIYFAFRIAYDAFTTILTEDNNTHTEKNNEVRDQKDLKSDRWAESPIDRMTCNEKEIDKWLSVRYGNMKY